MIQKAKEVLSHVRNRMNKVADGYNTFREAHTNIPLPLLPTRRGREGINAEYNTVFQSPYFLVKTKQDLAPTFVTEQQKQTLEFFTVVFYWTYFNKQHEIYENLGKTTPSQQSFEQAVSFPFFPNFTPEAKEEDKVAPSDELVPGAKSIINFGMVQQLLSSSETPLEKKQEIMAASEAFLQKIYENIPTNDPTQILISSQPDAIGFSENIRFLEHELRTPISIISGYSTLIQSYDEQSRSRLYTTINSYAQNLHILIDSIPKRMKGEKEITRMRISNIFDVAERILGNYDTFSYDFDEDTLKMLRHLQVDWSIPDEISAIQNIGNNTNDQVILRANANRTIQQIKNEGAITPRKSEGRIRLSVRESTRIIDNEEQAVIELLFADNAGGRIAGGRIAEGTNQIGKSTKRDKKSRLLKSQGKLLGGFALGLSGVKKDLEQVKGTIYLENNPEGVTTVVVLPKPKKT